MNARLRNPPLYNIQHHAPHNEWLVIPLSSLSYSFLRFTVTLRNPLRFIR
ncbi:unnamed protein product [Haemonchus placei]|uniref:Uncharacterized protein n=1 Tax=Haemonchus placei TaxID=6290 RepID=A0A0N4VYK9_HAEPC|nr:unnamed protein product [Haemonchus placei]